MARKPPPPEAVAPETVLDVPPLPEQGSEPPPSPEPLGDAGPSAPPEPGESERPRKRRRPRRAPEPEPSPAGPSPETLAGCEQALTLTVRVGMALIARVRGPHWAVEEDEARAVAQAWTQALAPYLDRVGRAMPWLAAIVITAGVVLPRIAQDRALAETPTLTVVPGGAAPGPEPRDA